MQDVERLSESEALVLAGLLRQMIRADGRFTTEERQALAHVALEIAVEPASTGAIGEVALYALMDEAAQKFATDDALRAAASTVTRPETRAAIHAMLFEVAASDTITVNEAQVLDWLAETWELEAPRDLEGEKTDVG